LVNFDLQTQTTADFYVNVITGPIALIFWKNHCVAIKKTNCTACKLSFHSFQYTPSTCISKTL